MQQPSILGNRSSKFSELAVTWPDYPSVVGTLLATVGASGALTGIAALTAQPWLSWLAMIVAVVILAAHRLRQQRVVRSRRQTQQILGARLVSRCLRANGPTPLRSFLERSDGVVLALTTDALLICQADRELNVIATIPLFNVQHVAIEQLHQLLATAADPALTVSVDRHGIAPETFAFAGFEVGISAAHWLQDLRVALPRAA